MADFCQQCSLHQFGEDFHDLKGLDRGQTLPPDEGWYAICEGCGLIVVDDEGRCVAAWCPEHGLGKDENP